MWDMCSIEDLQHSSAFTGDTDPPTVALGDETQKGHTLDTALDNGYQGLAVGEVVSLRQSLGDRLWSHGSHEECLQDVEIERRKSVHDRIPREMVWWVW